MKIHHLNCGTLCPVLGSNIGSTLGFSVGSKLSQFTKSLSSHFEMVCHCLLIETKKDGLVLVDTGLGVRDIDHSNRMVTKLLFNSVAKPVLDLNETAFYQIKKLGLNPHDVQHIIVTHLDADHVGGIADFPRAKVHVLDNEWLAAFRTESLKNKSRYLREQFSHGVDFKRYNIDGESWNGFKTVRELKGLPPEILMVPLPGHTMGHCGVVIENGESPLFFVGDAYIKRTQLIKNQTPLYLKAYNKLIQDDLKKFEHNLERLHDLHLQNPAIEIFCSHDKDEFHHHCCH